LGWAIITHPFHPLRGKRFEVLKTRQFAGTETLILRAPEHGSFALARDWTDWGTPEPDAASAAHAPKFAFASLVELTRLISVLSADSQKEL
jgi:hypothetical protein